MRVVANLAGTLDGRLAPATGPAMFGGALDRERMARLRAEADVVLTGGRSFCDWPLPPHAWRRWWPDAPERPPAPLFVVTRAARLLCRATTAGFPQADAALEVFGGPQLEPAPVEALGGTAHQVDDPLGAALATARARGARLLVVEGGWGLVSALLQSDSLDELRLTLCPRLLGGPPGTGSTTGETHLRLDAAELAAGGLFLRYTRP